MQEIINLDTVEGGPIAVGGDFPCANTASMSGTTG